jgi:hypothetical protein
MEVMPAQLRKALPPIIVTVLGITVFLQPHKRVFDDVPIIALQLSRESYTVLPSSTVMEVKPVQSMKASDWISVTEPGMVKEVRLLQLRKAIPPIEVN